MKEVTGLCTEDLVQYELPRNHITPLKISLNFETMQLLDYGFFVAIRFDSVIYTYILKCTEKLHSGDRCGALGK